MKVTVEDQIKMAETMIDRTDIEGTPFVLVYLKESKAYFGALGQYRLTELYADKDKALKETRKLNWNNIIKIMSIVVEQFKLNEK